MAIREPLTDEEVEIREDEVEAAMKTILANPVLAAEAYPNPEIRANILPFFQTIRRLGREAKQTISDRAKERKE